ncbi:MAG: NUDIX domain-containing protein [Patescibacteria group bacterium]|nr:NUDIX domain-containing protein [bacterium]MDZ4240951.1 NUDIX domain-containing protein [Patescibacteria group bacterium]
MILRQRVAAIVVKEDTVLLMHRINDGKEYYSFPGGGKEENESLETGALRELSEETTVDAIIDRLVYKVIWDSGDENYFYLCNYISGEPKLREDAEELKEMADGKQAYKPEWVYISDLPNTLLYQLEIRDLLIKDLKNGFLEHPQELFIKVEERRRI